MGKLIDFQGVDVNTRKRDRKKTVIIFSLFAFIFVIPFVLIPIVKIIQAQSWQEIPCSISIVKTKRRSFSGDYTQSYQAFYRYDFQGNEYQSSRFSFVKGVGLPSDEKARIAEDFPYGKEVKCYVSPDDPSYSVYDRGFHYFLVLWLVAPILLLYWCWKLFGKLEVRS